MKEKMIGIMSPFSDLPPTGHPVGGENVRSDWAIEIINPMNA